MSRPEIPEPRSTGSPPLRSSAREASAHYASRASHFEDQHTTLPMLKETVRGIRTSRQEESGDPDEEERTLGASSRELPFAHMRIHFADFARELRLHRHHEHRKRMLCHQRDRLRNAIALSARLQRVGSWVHDGLVQISQQSDPSGFTRVHQHMQDLVSLCQAQWHHEVHALDANFTSKTPSKEPFLAKLSTSSREDCLELLHTLRCNPRFLVDRFKAMNPDQVKGLSTSPKFKNLSESVLVSLSENRSREAQRRRPRSFLREYEDDAQLTRSKAYSKELEDYASSFERSNPLSFLIHNIYASSDDIESHESQLRLSTWSTICASLFTESMPAFEAIIGDVLSAFAHLHGWQIKERLQMFLMGSLQRGAFLYNSVEPSISKGRTDVSIFDSFYSTPQAQAFFDTEVRELFQILGSGDGGIPVGALRLGRAIVGKLPTLQSQSDFRGHFFFRWFLQDFLRIAMSFPEDENMLLQFHISPRARFHLLHKLWEHANARATDSVSSMPTQRVEEDVRNSVNWNIGQLDADQCINPYQAGHTPVTILGDFQPPYISICAADIAHLLEKLRPQTIHTSSPFDQFLSSSQATFNSQYSRAIPKFDRLCRRILDFIEPGHSSKNVHPCQESWALLLISPGGDLSIATPALAGDITTAGEGLGDLDPVQTAVLRLAASSLSLHAPTTVHQISDGKAKGRGLSEMFAEESRTSHIQTDSLTSMYWHNALNYLRTYYPLTVLTGDDTKVLGPILQRLNGRQILLANECLQLQQEVADLEASYACARTALATAADWLDKLRVKLWYAMAVTSSDAYDNARNITVALNNMAILARPGAISGQEYGGSPEPSRPGSSMTSASSIFDQPRIDTETIMKAPVEYGGPRKLSDAQIEKTKKWLERNHVENFCRGEERIHRFCMEVKLLIRKLVGDTIASSPVLWSSELFARERGLYDIHAGLYGGPSTRPPSVMSEPLSSTSFPLRPAFAGSRASIFGGSSRLGKDGLGSDISSYISSPGRATTSTTLESASIWSRTQSNSRSVTSVSQQSRPASTFEGSHLNRSVDRSPEKANFLETLRQDLSSLLLSDLACPVWSCGSESDAWMDAICQTPGIMERLHQRSALAHLLPPPNTTLACPASSSKGPRKHKQRSHSAAPHRSSSGKHDCDPGLDPVKKVPFSNGRQPRVDDFPYRSAFNDILCRVRDHTDPVLKLKAIRDFKLLSQDFQQNRGNGHETSPALPPEAADAQDGTRRRSLDPNILSANRRRNECSRSHVSAPTPTENEESLVVQSLKDLLHDLRPKTLFRDLQYIAAFASSDNLDDPELGQAFLHMGLAALAWKDEVCRSMVDVADRIVARDSIKRNISSAKKKREPSVLKAMEYWIVGAREGNAIAQRELASLYLTHPDVPPIVSLPLTLSSDIFKSDMMWEGEGEFRRNSQALCLALHWMQEAAKNGDVVAQMKLKEREAGRSIR
ncbi:hypothetical protein CLCR_09440 [Cladophialophora carrionii]|uniref:Uncharacterized protein n=1 Tax=Cladophialophora carrionii TaxID=86049 RepID=A0A1C1CVS2_9EURO|nr:hypothetical protein CLCR_09440 [Cladophialophora carrionii]